MSDYVDEGQRFLFHYGVKGMRWGKTTKSGPTAKGDLRRAVVGGFVLAPESTARTAARITNKVNKESTKIPAKQQSQTKAQQAKTSQRQKRGETATKVALTMYIARAAAPAIGPVGGLIIGAAGSNKIVNNYKANTANRTPAQKASQKAAADKVKATGRQVTNSLLRR